MLLQRSANFICDRARHQLRDIDSADFRAKSTGDGPCLDEFEFHCLMHEVSIQEEFDKLSSRREIAAAVSSISVGLTPRL